MNFLPFFCNINALSSPLRDKLNNKNFAISFSKGEDTIFDNIQTILYKNLDKCCVVYVGYTTNEIYFMIQVSEQYIKTVRDFGQFDAKNEEVFLNTSISKKLIPFFYKIFIHEGGEHAPQFCIEQSSAEMLCVQSYKIGEVQTEKDFNHNVMSIMQVGEKIFSEYENAIEAENKSNIAKEIGTVLRFFFRLS